MVTVNIWHQVRLRIPSVVLVDMQEAYKINLIYLQEIKQVFQWVPSLVLLEHVSSSIGFIKDTVNREKDISFINWMNFNKMKHDFY